MAPDKKQIILNAFVMDAPGHLSPGLWRHPQSKTSEYKKLSFWTGLAKLLDDAGFHGMFIADTVSYPWMTMATLKKKKKKIAALLMLARLISWVHMMSTRDLQTSSHL